MPPRTHCARASAASGAISTVSHRFGVAESLSACVGYSYSVVVAPTGPDLRDQRDIRPNARRAALREPINRTEVTPTRASGARYDTVQAGIRDEVWIRLAVAAAAQK